MKSEKQWDKELKIDTCGRDASGEDAHHYPYEPTPYCVLERLAKSGYLDRDCHVVDYGCGKGRVGFYLNHALGCRVTGLEYDEKIYGSALENNRTFVKKTADMEFMCADAAAWPVEDADCFYFFNPFSVEILRAVMGRIMDSYYSDPRQMYLFFYYPNEEYVAYLMTAPELMFADEIPCQDLFEGENDRERILIFEVI